MVRSTWSAELFRCSRSPTATIKFGTKVVTATYYRAHCENSLYYRTSREHGSTSCCISQCPVHYPVKFDADIFIQSGVIDIFPKSKMVFVLCTKLGKNICTGHWGSGFRRLFDDVTRINFRFQLLVTWSSSHDCDASSHKIWCRYLYPIQSYWHFFFQN